jgi:hypothetical protein
MSSFDERGPLAVLKDWFQTVRERERLDSEGARLLESTAVTRQIVADLDAGRLSLREAAASLWAERERRPPRLQGVLTSFRGESVEESFLREMLWEAECRLEGDSRRREILARLRAQYHAILNGDATGYEEGVLIPTTREKKPSWGEATSD